MNTPTIVLYFIVMVILVGYVLMTHSHTPNMSTSNEKSTISNEQSTPTPLASDGQPTQHHIRVNLSSENDDNVGPRMIIMDGCSGSSATYRFTIKLLEAHGVHIGYNITDKSELLKPAKNPFYDSVQQTLEKKYQSGILPSKPTYNDIMLESLIEMHHKYQQNDENLFFKANQQFLYTIGSLNTLFNQLLQNNSKFASLYRANIVDHAICSIRDCFGDTEDIGYDVFATNGTRSDLCFKRRFVNDETKVHISNTHEFIHYLQRIEHRRIRQQQHLEMILPSTEQSMEDLFAYEYSNDEVVFEKSVKAWANFIRSMVDHVNEDTIAMLMRENQNTRMPPSAHSTVIENIDEVVSAIQEHMPKYLTYLRVDDEESIAQV